MANITPYVSQILSAIYGREVRSSIANALNAMNSEINVDLTAVQNSTNQAMSYANAAKASENAATSAATQATTASESANNDRLEANRSRILAQQAAAIAQDLLSYANYEKVYIFIRDKILQQEGYEVTRSLEDSEDNPILDSDGNPILGRYILDPLKFEDILEYVEGAA